MRLKKKKKAEIDMARPPVPRIVWAIVIASALLVHNCPSAAAGMTAEWASTQLESVTVTAQKQEENLQEVPLSVSAFNDLETEDRGIETVTDLTDFIPNLQLISQGVAGINVPVMRGVSAAYGSMTVSTGMFVDGIPILNGNGYEEVISAIERVEVLRGPQGTLYGKGTETGAINIITRQPTNDFKGMVSVQGGTLLSKETGDGLTQSYMLDLSGPIVKDTLFYGLAGQHTQKDGFIKNTHWDSPANDSENWHGRGKIRWLPTDQWDVTFTLSHLENNDDGSQLGMSDMGAGMFGVPAPGARQIASDFLGYHEFQNDSQSLKVEYNINEKMALTSITSNWNHDRDQLMDYDFSPFEYMHINTIVKADQLSQELRLNYSSGKLKWLAGVYLDAYENYVYSITGSTNVTADNTIEGQSYAAFGNVTYEIFYKFSAVAGVRYEKNDQEYENRLSGQSISESWEVITPKLSLQYQMTPEVMTYITAAEGYRSGGFNASASNIAPEYYAFDPEKLWSYELGIKSSLFNNRLMVNAAVFYMDIDDMQVEEAINPTDIYMTNAAKASGVGAELEINARITNTFGVTGSFGITEIEFDEFSDSQGNYQGNTNPYAPAYTFNLGAQYRHPKGFFARADLIGYGRMYFNKENTYSRDPYMIVNLKIGYETERYDIYLQGKNIFDKEYNSEGMFNGFYNIYSEPGEIALKVAYRF
ncbi:MAG: TonB-dependent receptor [Desulfobacterales bacterium]|nr:TonB-dependent receptor [Desulfobacterales bacterium]